MTFQNRGQKIFFLLVTIVAWGGFAISNELEWRRKEEKMDRLVEGLHQRRADQARADENFQRRLGCKGEVVMGFCMDPPCMDSDASGADDQRYVPGDVKSCEQMSILPHRIIKDECIDTSDLREGTCKLDMHGGAAQPEWVVIHCDKGCRDGACIR